MRSAREVAEACIALCSLPSDGVCLTCIEKALESFAAERVKEAHAQGVEHGSFRRAGKTDDDIRNAALEEAVNVAAYYRDASAAQIMYRIRALKSFPEAK